VAFFVYILASKRNGTLYVGMTDNLAGRIWQHRNGTFSGFTQRYDVKTLVWFEIHNSRDLAFARERRQEMGKSLEARADRTGKPALARSLARNFVALIPSWIPASAGMSGADGPFHNPAHART
jgi:putative endonuclease